MLAHLDLAVSNAAIQHNSVQVDRFRSEGQTSTKSTRHALVLIAAYMYHHKRSQKKKPGRPYSLKKEKRPSFWNIVRSLGRKDFKRTFRLTCYQFRLLVGRLRPILDSNRAMANRASGLIQAEIKVALLLRILAGANHNDLCLIFKIQTSKLYDVFGRTLRALTSTFKLPGIPEDVEELKKMARKFKLSRSNGSPLNGCIGALDGIAVKIRKPHKSFHPAQFYCRKGFYAIPVQAMVDSDYRFRCFSALCVGATHDSLSHEISALGKHLREGKLPYPFWIAADEAYVCTEFLLTPFASSSFDRSSLSKYKDAFNFFQSSLRMHVEQAFRILVGRFGILWRPLGFSLDTNTRVVLAIMILHNVCIDNATEPKSETMSEADKREQETAFRVWYHESLTNIRSQHEIASNVNCVDRGMEKSAQRREMVNMLRSLRLVRPYGQDRFDDNDD